MVAALVVAAAARATAADLPQPVGMPLPPAYSWTGFYIGINGGYGSGYSNCGGATGSTVSFNENIVRAGVNFKFAGW
jgi:outer membrane immunogenic protein